MEISEKKLIKSLELEKKIETICSFNYAKCEFIQGRILNIEKTNISFIEPHRIIIKVNNKKILVIYFDKNNIFLYDRSKQITLDQLILILKKLKEF